MEVSRLKRRVEKDRYTEWVNTHSVSIVIHKNLPKFVYMWKARLDLESFISQVWQCFKCGKLGHISKNCEGVEKYLTCAKNKHQEDGTCMATLVCISCSGQKMPKNNRILGDPEDRGL